MKTFLISIAAVAALSAAAAPAMAQPMDRGANNHGGGSHRPDYPRGGPQNDNLREGRAASARAADALARANQVLHSGRVSRGDTMIIHRQAGDLAKARNRYSSNGWMPQEINDLNQRTAELNASIDRATSGPRGGPGRRH
ncbi:MAG: hypothetical protein JWP35_1874 [Caulobacter sp.]|nr:hypothetical protein [Caulobacter sp.]